MTIEPGFGRSVVRGAGLAIGVALVALVILVGLAAIQVLVLMFIAVILASGLQPIIDWLRGRLPIGRSPTILIVYGMFLATVVGLTVVVVPTAIAQAQRVVASVPPALEAARTWAATLEPAAVSRTVTALIDEIAATVKAPGAAQPDQVIAVGLTVAQTVMVLLTLLTVVYFWLTERARLQRYILAFVPRDRRRGSHRAWNAAESRLGRWVRGELILMGAIGLGTSVAYTLLGVPAALLLGLFAALAEAIPIVGPLIGAIPAVLVALTVSPQLALVVAGVYLVLQIIEGNVLVPIVMRNTIGISPFLVILSVLIGGAAGGFAGALLAVPIAAVGEVLIEGFQRRAVPVAQDPLATEAIAGRTAEADDGEGDGETRGPDATAVPAGSG
ncbi:MAG TPA: AI-2E family transporter [Candidatus Limnocylindrales bacterium]